MKHEELHIYLEKITRLFEAYPFVATLIVLIMLDIFSGIAVAFGTKRVSSSASFRGMCKKAVEIIIVGAASAIEPFAQGIPLGKLVALFYIFTEGFSILENAAMLGVPLPGVLVETLTKLKAANHPQPPQPPPNGPVMETHIHTTRPVTVKEAPTEKGKSQKITVKD